MSLPYSVLFLYLSVLLLIIINDLGIDIVPKRLLSLSDLPELHVYFLLLYWLTVRQLQIFDNSMIISSRYSMYITAILFE